jgi:hypothetical protein
VLGDERGGTCYSLAMQTADLLITNIGELATPEGNEAKSGALLASTELEGRGYRDRRRPHRGRHSLRHPAHLDDLFLTREDDLRCSHGATSLSDYIEPTGRAPVEVSEDKASERIRDLFLSGRAGQ